MAELSQELVQYGWREGTQKGWIEREVQGGIEQVRLPKGLDGFAYSFIKDAGTNNGAIVFGIAYLARDPSNGANYWPQVQGDISLEIRPTGEHCFDFREGIFVESPTTDYTWCLPVALYDSELSGALMGIRNLPTFVYQGESTD